MLIALSFYFIFFSFIVLFIFLVVSTIVVASSCQRVFYVVSLWVFLVLSHLVFFISIWLHLRFYYCYFLRFWRFLVVGSLHIKVLLIVVLGHKVLVLAWFVYYVIPNGASSYIVSYHPMFLATLCACVVGLYLWL